jgi:acyl dehydratase
MPGGGTVPKREVADIQELQSLVGQEVAIGDWLEITQERIDQFADATSDHQWIHVDVERCKRESPFGTTIAHGYLTLSLVPHLTQQSFAIRQPLGMTINYGSNKVRFTNPVPAGSRIRTRMKALEVNDVPDGWQVRWQVTVEIEGKEKPACVAETLSRLYKVR